MKYYVGVTDMDWYQYLQTHKVEDINFWQPGGGRQFAVIPRGAPFLFKLKAPYNAIGGVGFFSAAATQSLESAWDYFGQGNGCQDYRSFRQKILAYKAKTVADIPNPIVIGCIILTDPIFFDQRDWIPAPSNWSAPIVQGKGYDTDEAIGAALWEEVQIRLRHYHFYERQIEEPSELALGSEVPEERYRDTITRVRLGQGTFRILVTDAYSRACAITGDHTLPVLEAAHIRPYAESGPHLISNGLLLRSDLHKLFDSGYLTITPDLHVEVSPSLREEFHNGKEYYAMHGRKLSMLPEKLSEHPNKDFLTWHNENVYKAG